MAGQRTYSTLSAAAGSVSCEPNPAGRSGIRRLRYIRSTSFLLALAFVALGAATNGAGHRLPGTGLPIDDSKLAAFRSSSFFPMGWFDSLKSPGLLPGMRSAGMNIVMPYQGNTKGGVRPYLDDAKKQGMKVIVQIDPMLLAAPNPVLVRRFVQNYRSHPAVGGWLLMDEPTVDPKYKAVTPGVAEMLYRQIKAADPSRSVSIVFGVTEDPRPYLHAMDVMMYDDYVQGVGTPEFWGLQRWRARLNSHAVMSKSLDGYIPVLQAFGPDSHGNAQIHKRLPTTNEMRYITYTALQYQATGLMFWVRYRSQKTWIDHVLTPLSKEIAPALKALAARPITGASSAPTSMLSMLFRDPSSGALYLLAVHHNGGTVKAQINLQASLRKVKATASNGVHAITSGKMFDSFGPYAARLYRLS